MYQERSFDRKRWSRALGTIVAVSLLAGAAAAQNAVKCKRTIARETAKYEATRSKQLQKCEDGVLQGKITGPCPDAETAGKITQAMAKMDDKISAACTGLTMAAIDFDGLVKRCVSGTSGPRCDGGANALDPCTGDIDCPGGTCTIPGNECTSDAQCPGSTCGAVDECPAIENRNLPAGECTLALTGATDIVDCLQCIGDGVTTQLNTISFAHLAPNGGEKAVLKCQRTIGKAASKFFQKKIKILQKCEDAVLQGKITGPCPDTAAATAIADAEAKLLDKIARACGGDDKTLGTADDLSLGEVGGPVFCPAYDIPGAGPGCAATIADMQDLAECVRCLTEFKVDCAHRAANPGGGAVPAECNPTCGNGSIDAGETCDDGNSESGDACPSDCSIASCVDIGDTTATVSFTAPAGIDIAGLTVLLEYPDAKVRIPGSGAAPSVINAIGMTPAGTVYTPNDLNYALRLVIFEPDSLAIPAGTLFQVTFDTCQGAGALTASDMTCRVENASNTAQVAVGGVNCAVTVP